jgi:ribose-phosphate pyrophosphokinase
MLIGRQAADLYMPYCPYARQDKEIRDNATFALHAFLEILESMGWSCVWTIDMHNPQAVVGYNFNWLNNKMTPDCSAYDTVIFPDAGAARRYDIDHPNIVIGHKVRDQETGWITHYELEGEVMGNCIVVDDLCDGGLTFKLLAKSITQESIKRLDLSVTHGIFSKGLGELLDWYDTIHTTNSFFGHTIRTQTMMQDLEDYGLGRKEGKWRNGINLYEQMWNAVQRQQLVIQGV